MKGAVLRVVDAACQVKNPDPPPREGTNEATTADLLVGFLAHDDTTVVFVSVPVSVGCLTETERAIARSVAQGKSNRDIAKERGRAVRTIANHVASIYRKLGVNSRAELTTSFAAEP